VKGEACKPREIARCGAVPVKPTRAEPASPPVVGFLLFGGDEDEQGTRGENQGCERENQFVDWCGCKRYEGSLPNQPLFCKTLS
jgi:hypothetical protein